jgi:hypothetical protein
MAAAAVSFDGITAIACSWHILILLQRLIVSIGKKAVPTLTVSCNFRGEKTYFFHFANEAWCNFRYNWEHTRITGYRERYFLLAFTESSNLLWCFVTSFSLRRDTSFYSINFLFASGYLATPPLLQRNLSFDQRNPNSCE